jgi:glycosyltransferase involved in cell wall biosynthesis
MTLNILCVHQGYELYGSDRSFIRSLKAIRQFAPSARVTVELPKPGPLVAHVRPLADDVAVRDLGVVRGRDMRRLAVGTFGRILAAVPATVARIDAFDVVYVNSVVVLDFVLAARFGRAATVLHVREIPGRLASAVLGRCLRFSRATLVFNSHATRRAFGFGRRPAHVLHNGTDGFAGVPPPGVDADAFRVLLIGRINAWKGHAVLLDALTRLGQAERKAVEVRIVGDVFEDQSAHRERLVALCRQHGLQQTVQFHPFDADPAPHYAWSDVVVVPSTSPEPFGNVAVEAMSAARPVIASAHGGIVEIVQDGVTGLLVTPRDAAALATALSSLIHDRPRAAAMGRAGYRRFTATFTEAAYRAGLGAILRDVVATRVRTRTSSAR